MKLKYVIVFLIAMLVAAGLCSCAGRIEPRGMSSDIGSDSVACVDSSGKTVLSDGESADVRLSEYSSETTDANSEITGKYKKIIEDNLLGIDGNVCYAFHEYTSGCSFASPEQKMKSASIIKLFIMEYAFSLVENSDLTLDSQISSRKLSSLLELMITVSDNTATNILIDYFGMGKLNEYFVSAGYTGTVLGRKMLDFDALSRGQDNFTTANDVMKFLDRLYASADEGVSKQMLDIMKRQKVATKIRRHIPAGVEIASKTGELSDVENDAGIIFTDKGDFALVILTNNVKNPDSARNAIAQSAYAIYNQYIY